MRKKQKAPVVGLALPQEVLDKIDDIVEKRSNWDYVSRSHVMRTLIIDGLNNYIKNQEKEQCNEAGQVY